MNRQQSEDQFQVQKDEVLTYSYSSNMNPISINKGNDKTKRINQQKLTLNIIKRDKQLPENDILKINNKLHKRNIYANEGKVINIGHAVFKSNFQSGSFGEVTLAKGVGNTYRISLEKQINSNRTSSWFYFRCEGLRGEVNFIVSGFTKTSSLYNEGMKVCFRQINNQNLSNVDSKVNQSNTNRVKQQWKRGCTKISYAGNYNCQKDQNTFQLKFTYNFIKNPETSTYQPVEFAYCFPYEFKRVNTLAKHLSKKGLAIVESLGKSYQGRDIPLITIGNPNATKSIIISARVHPGQTVSSYLMEGFLKQLTSQSQFATYLRDKYIFKIVPMINPDGVVRGNYRFSASGYDLNRRWKHCYQSSHPQIHHLKNMIKKIHKQKKVLMYIDLHGHSRKKSAFFYGCSAAAKDNIIVEDINGEDNGLTKPQQFPYLMSKLSRHFKYDFCSFNMTKDKQGTARIAMRKQLHINYVYTLETSFCSDFQGGKNYTQIDYLGMGKTLLQGISIYFYEKPALSARQSTMTGSQEVSTFQKHKPDKPSIFDKFLNIRNQAKQELKNNPILQNIGMNNQQSGSDSEPQTGTIPEQQRILPSATLDVRNPILNEINKKQKISTKFTISKSPIFNSNHRQIKIQQQQVENQKIELISKQLKSMVEYKLQNLKTQQQQKSIFQKRIIAKTVNNFYSNNSQQLNSLTVDSLVMRNDRVHSNHNNQRRNIQKMKSQRMNSENQAISHKFGQNTEQNEQQDQKKKLQIMSRNLLKTREGAQYRRVKKVAEQMKKRNNTFTAPNSVNDQGPIPMVRGIITVTNQLNFSKKKIKSIAPSFYPHSQQKNRKFSVQIAYRNNSNFRSGGKIPLEFAGRKLCINGDDISVRCKGSKIYM